MRFSFRAATTGFLVVVSILAHAPEALARGGCFVPPEDNTVVTDHRMVLSVGQAQPTDP